MMIRQLVWLTDIHLNFVDDAKRELFLRSVGQQGDVVAVSGDITDSRQLSEHLREMDEFIGKPIYFVLGNHDFYHSSVAKTRPETTEIARHSKHLDYLTVMGAVELSSTTAIIGHDGWPDGRVGDYDNSNVILSDHLWIAEISKWYERGILDKRGLSTTLRSLADEAAGHLETTLEDAACRYQNIILVTHVPPFREASWHEGRVSDEDYLPYFACEVVGDILRRVMQAHPPSRLLVLCGHTHGGGELKVLENLHVLTGEAEYGEPAIQQVVNIENWTWKRHENYQVL